MKLKKQEYKSPKSVRQPKWLKMYAELARIRKCKKLRIKSHSDNKTAKIKRDMHLEATQINIYSAMRQHKTC